METFEEWFGGKRLALLRFATALAVDHGTAQEVVQEVAYRANLRWESIALLEHRDAYLRRMVVNEYLSWRRKWGRLVPVPEPADDRPGTSRDAIQESDDRHWLRTELARLPPRQRAVVVLRFYEGLDDVEIAAALRCPRGTVRSLQSRALKRLRVEMAGTEQPTAPAALSHRLVVRPDQQES